jgi:formylglycine-generating enzyme required for sulfatase activity
MVSASDGMVMVYVPAGEFEMGSEVGERNEFPLHSVYLEAFWIDQTEVTNAMYAAFLNEQGNQAENGAAWFAAEDEDALIERSGGQWAPKNGYADHPVIEVTWYGAQAYCQWAGRRLPTEAEWEKSARGEDGRTYPWGDIFDCRKGNFDDERILDDDVVPGGERCDGFERTAPGGSFPQGASLYGALDMAGNVWEWGADWYDADYYANSPPENPQGPSSGENRVLRGGSWETNSILFVRTADRHGSYPTSTEYHIGFRCAMDAP